MSDHSYSSTASVGMSDNSYSSNASIQDGLKQQSRKRLFNLSGSTQEWLVERNEERAHLDSCIKCTLGISILLIFASSCCNWGYCIREIDNGPIVYAGVAAIVSVIVIIGAVGVFYAALCHSNEINDAVCCLKQVLIATDESEGEHSLAAGCAKCLTYTVVILCLGPLPVACSVLMLVQAIVGTSAGFAGLTAVMYLFGAVCGFGVVYCMCAASSSS